jgi:hypothetical protein
MGFVPGLVPGFVLGLIVGRAIGWRAGTTLTGWRKAPLVIANAQPARTTVPRYLPMCEIDT